MKLLMVILIASVWLTCYDPAPHCTRAEFNAEAKARLFACRRATGETLSSCAAKGEYESWRRAHAKHALKF